MLSSVIVHPSYFPPIAQFSLMLMKPCVWEVSDNFQKQTYRNRMYIYGANGTQMLSVPVKHTKSEQGHQIFKEVRVESGFFWQKQHWKTLETAYRTAPYFEFYEDTLQGVFETSFTFLLDLNIATIEAVLSCLRQDVMFSKTTSYQEFPKEGEDFRHLTDAKKGKSFDFPSYYQIFSDKHGFLSNLSILDALFHQGPETISYLHRVSQLVYAESTSSS